MRMKLKTKILLAILVAAGVLVTLTGAKKPNNAKNEKKDVEAKVKKFVKSINRKTVKYECVPKTKILNCYYKTNPYDTQYCCKGIITHYEYCLDLAGYPNGVWCNCANKLCKTTTTPTPPEEDTTPDYPEVTDSPPTPSKSQTNPATNKPPSVITAAPAKKPIRCYACESTQGDTSLPCKDDPKSTKVIFCKPGQLCRSVSFISVSRGGSVIIRGCADPNDATPIKLGPWTRKDGSKGKKPKAKNNQGQSKRKGDKRAGIPRGCTVNPTFLGCPDGECDQDCPNGDCDHYSCSCTCDKNLCNKAIGAGQGWDLCAQL